MKGKLFIVESDTITAFPLDPKTYGSPSYLIMSDIELVEDFIRQITGESGIIGLESYLVCDWIRSNKTIDSYKYEVWSKLIN